MATLFYLQKTGSGSVGASTWIDLGAIPTGYKCRIGISNFGSIAKAITFDIRTNKLTKSAGTLTDTTTIGSCAVSSKTKPNPFPFDLYKNGTLNKSTVLGSGTEHWWLYLSAKSATMAAYTYTINYMLV